MLRADRLRAVASLDHGFLSAGVAPPEGALRVRQVHGAEVVVADGLDAAALADRGADSLVASTSVAVAIRTADCLPVLFALPDGERFAAAHAGWRGLLAGVLPRTVEVLLDGDGGAGRVVAAIGPAIERCCYEVNGAITADFERAWGHLWRGEPPPWSEVQRPSRGPARPPAVGREGGRWIDLQRIARLQLQALGVPGSAIEVPGGCTYCGPPHFASYRRATHEGAPRNYQWSWIGRAPAAEAAERRGGTPRR